MANLSKALNTDMAGLAQILRKKGRGKDSVLAHITPKEAALLKARGGSGTINPDTGLPEFDDYSEVSTEPTPVNAPNTGFVPSQTQAVYGDTGPSADVMASRLPPGVSVPDVAQTSQTPQYVASDAMGGEVPAGVSFPDRGQTLSGYYQGDTVYSPTGTPYSQPQLDRLSVDQPAGVAPTTSPNILEKAYDKISNYASGDKGSDTLTRMGLATALGLYGASTNRAAAAGNRAATAETQAIAAPYQQQGQNLIAQAQAGALSPASQQAYAAAQAQMAQAQSGRGGVGAQQTANQMATLYQTLLNNQYTYGLQVAQIGDNIAVGAIKQGLAMDQSINQSTQNFYTNLASIVAGVPPGYRQVASTTPTTPTGG